MATTLFFSFFCFVLNLGDSEKAMITILQTSRRIWNNNNSKDSGWYWKSLGGTHCVITAGEQRFCSLQRLFCSVLLEVDYQGSQQNDLNDESN